jgi:hypothetical protein
MRRLLPLLIMLVFVGSAAGQSITPNGVAGSISPGSLSPYTGAVGITGNQGNGSDFINAVCVNGVCSTSAFGASGSSTTTVGTIAPSSTSLSVTNIQDFKVGNGIEIIGAGAANTAVAPTGVAAAPLDWTASSPWAKNSVIQPLLNNAGNKFYKVTGGAVAISHCFEVSTTATCYSNNSGPLPFGQGASVTVSGSSVSGYNITATVTSVQWLTAALAWTFSYTAAGSLAEGNGGTGLYTGANPGGGQSSNAEPGTWNQTSTGTQQDGMVQWTECTGTCNSQTYSYTLVARDVNRAYAAPTSAATCSNATLSLVARCIVTWTPGANDQDIVICRGNVPVNVSPAADGTWTDVGNTSIQGTHPDIPSGICTASGGAGPLVTSISTIVGTTVTVANAATTQATSQVVSHDDTVALNAFATALMAVKGQMGFCNNGTYLTTSPWLFDGEAIGAGGGITLLGANGTTQAPAGCHIVYHGPAYASTATKHGAMILDGVNSSVFSELSIDSNAVATAAIQPDNSDGSHPGSGLRFDHIFAGNVSPAQFGMAMSVGFSGCSGNQLSEIYADHFSSVVSNNPSPTAVMFKSWCGSNQKDFTLSHLVCLEFNRCVKTSSNGKVAVYDLQDANNTGVLFDGGTEIGILEFGEAEDQSAVGTRLFNWQSNTNQNSLRVESFSFQTPPPPDGAVGLAGTNDNVVSMGNNFYDGPSHYAVKNLTSSGDTFLGNYNPTDMVQATPQGYPAGCGTTNCNQQAVVQNEIGGATGTLSLFGSWNSFQFPAPLANSGTCGAIGTATTGQYRTQNNSLAACVLGTTATTGGTTNCVIYCNGTNWVQTGF